MVVEVAGECGLCINKERVVCYCITVEKANQMGWVLGGMKVVSSIRYLGKDVGG